MSLSEELIQPARSWDELVKGSLRRGELLRWRRRGAACVPVLGLAVVVSTLLASSVPGAAGLVVTPVPPAAEAAPGTSRQAGGGPGQESGPASEGALAGPPAPAAAQGLPSDEPADRPRTQRAKSSSRNVSFLDRPGDAAASTGGDGGFGTVTVGASIDELDIVEMRFQATATGVSVQMLVAEDPQSDFYRYYATLADAATGCELRVHLGQPRRDGFFLFCDGIRSGGFVAVPESDRSALFAFIPYRLFPRQVSPDRPLRLAGMTYDDPATPPPFRPPGGPSAPDDGPPPGVALRDTATTDRTLSRR